MFDKDKVEKSHHYSYICFGSRLKDTAAQMEETAVEAREIGEAVRHTAQQTNQSASVRSKSTVREAVTKVKSKKLILSKICLGRYQSRNTIEQISTKMMILSHQVPTAPFSIFYLVVLFADPLFTKELELI